MDKKVTILSFSTRGNGNCARISEYLTQFYNRTNVQAFVIDSGSFSPCGGCSYECLKPGQKCPRLNTEHTAIMNRICDSDLVFFIVPNYCGYPCANYFAFNERTVGFFNLDKELMNRYMSVKKGFIIISNTQGNNFVTAMRQQTAGEPDMLYLQTRKYGKQSIAGDLLESEDAIADLDAYLSHLTL